MNYHLAYRRYRLPFRAPVRTAHGRWTEREGVLVRVTGAGDGVVGYGEVAPIPDFGTETVDEAEAVLRELGAQASDDRIAAVPTHYQCVRQALAAAREVAGPVAGGRSIGVAALLPAGRAALEALRTKEEMGFRVFKWKVGVGDVADELSLLDDLCGALPAGAKMRLDANGAWDRRKSERWLERCADRPVEFLEQPVAVAARGAEDLLRGLAEDFPTPIALDESIASERDIERWVGAGWPGIYVVKPSLLGDVAGVMARLKLAKAKLVFSSALETAVGAKATLRWAFQWDGEVAADGTTMRRALGFGVWPLFADARFDGPFAAPFLRWDDVERLNAEAVWNALN